MPESTIIGKFLTKLYPIVCKATEKYKDTQGKGAKFEDEVSQSIYDLALESGFKPNTPRYTLRLPTRSNNKHQFDASFTNNKTYYLVECKNTQSAAKDYLYYFNSKIMDYTHSNPEYSFKGLFLCAASVPESAWKYSIAYGLRVLDPDSPPPEYMIENCVNNSALITTLKRHIEKIEDAATYGWEEGDGEVTRLYEEYKYYVNRWRNQ